MPDRHTRSFDSPDEIVEIGRVRSQILTMGGAAMARDVQEPGWRWSEDVRPEVGTEWCETRHVGYTLSGRGHIVLADGLEFDVEPGDLFDIQPGHDAWVVGDEPWVTITWMGVTTWLSNLQTLKERVLVTLVFTDIVDSTLLAASKGDRAWGELLSSHDIRMADEVDRHRGTVAKLTGDGMVAIFDGAGRAIRCALACQRAAAELGLQLRVAVHTGEIEASGDEFHGIALHETARMVSLAEPGEIVVSDMTRQLARDHHLRFLDRGTAQLKGLETPLHLHSILVD
ncbi:MAG: adenylate/guanylate cyclase domain-containing protein [Acidimicrobiia bacterium]